MTRSPRHGFGDVRPVLEMAQRHDLVEKWDDIKAGCSRMELDYESCW